MSKILHDLFFSTGAFGYLEGCYDFGNTHVKWNNLNFSSQGEDRYRRNIVILLWLKGYIGSSSYEKCSYMIRSLPYALWNIGYDPNTERYKIYLEFDRSNGVSVSHSDRQDTLKIINHVFVDTFLSTMDIDNISVIGFDIYGDFIDLKIYTHHPSLLPISEFRLPFPIKNYCILETVGSKRRKEYYQFYTPLSLETILTSCPFLMNGEKREIQNIHMITREETKEHNFKYQFYYIHKDFDSNFFFTHPLYQPLWNRIQSHLH